jgi:hypothetical protein
MNELIDADEFFQTLISNLSVSGLTVGADLGPDAGDQIPFISHNSILSQNANGPGLWTVNLTLTLYLEVTTTTFQTVKDVYAGVHGWGNGMGVDGFVMGLAAVVDVEDVQAFTRVGQDVALNNKTVTQYVGSFELSIRNI